MPEEGKTTKFVKSKVEVVKGCSPPPGYVCESHAPIDYPDRISVMSHLYHHACFQSDIDTGKCTHHAAAGAWKAEPLGASGN